MFLFSLNRVVPILTLSLQIKFHNDPNKSYRPFSHGGHVESQENKKLCFRAASLVLPEFAPGRGLPCKKTAFYFPETQHCHRVIRVYCAAFSIVLFSSECFTKYSLQIIFVLARRVKGLNWPVAFDYRNQREPNVHLSKVSMTYQKIIRIFPAQLPMPLMGLLVQTYPVGSYIK